jgi:diadenosine tetraphosphatase ApaH/serine/threonine PP2A family protein phosphatase
LLELNLTRLSLALHDLHPATSSSQPTSDSEIQPPQKTDLTFHLPRDLSRLAPSDVCDLLHYFTEPPYTQTLHPYYFQQLLLEGQTILHKRPPIVRVSTTTDSVIHVVGDLHGSLPDLAEIIDTFGPPSPTNQYIFNGDFVDRGPHGVEVLAVILAFLISSPENVFLNRGNHEDTHVSKAYGFHHEVQDKFGRAPVWNNVTDFYSSLPIATVIPPGQNGGAFVVHAGVGNLIPMITKRGHCNVQKGGASVLDDDHIADLLWSDPQPDASINGIQPNTARGAGKLFGTDMALKVLDNFGVAHFVRSHQTICNGVDSQEIGPGKHL